jgi:DNA replication protein DnaC
MKEKEEEDRERQRKSRIALFLRESQIPPRFRNCTIQGFNGDGKGISHAWDVANGYVKKFQKHKEKGRSLVFYGKPGTGKTHLACAIGLECIKQVHSVRYTTEFKLTRAVKNTWKPDSEYSEAEIFQGYQNPDLLIVDEIGVSFHSDTEKMILYQIINGRYERILPTILISNLMKKELVRDHAGVTVAFDWESYRK